MPLALSNDLRWRVVWLHHYKELSCKEISDLLYIHISTVYRILDRFQECGTVAPVSHQSGPASLLGSVEEHAIADALMSKPEIFLSELQNELFERTGTRASISTIFRTIRRLGFSRKKLRQVVLRRSDSLRAEFMEEMNYLTADMIVWLDETGSDRRSENRKFGYHLRGITPCSYKLSVRGKRLSCIAAMSNRGIEDVDIYEGSIDGAIFSTFIARSLVPLLQPFDGRSPRSVVVMDNASIHHVDQVASAIQSTGAILRYLPPYSPDYNPLEESFAKVKAFLKENEVAYDTTDDPRLLIMMAFNSVTEEDCKGYIRHAGYKQ